MKFIFSYFLLFFICCYYFLISFVLALLLNPSRPLQTPPEPLQNHSKMVGKSLFSIGNLFSLISCVVLFVLFKPTPTSWPGFSVREATSCWLCYHILYPAPERGEPGVDPRVRQPGTLLAPGDHSNLPVGSVLAQHSQRATAVSLTGIRP